VILYVQEMIIYIKNMVCIRCKLIVESALEKMGLHKISIVLGEAKIKENISAVQREELNSALMKSGLELLDLQKSRDIEKIKNCVIELVHYSGEHLKNFPDYLSKKLEHDYAWLNNLFFEVQNNTIENFLLKHKIERVKELLVYNTIKLSDIASQLNFSSVSQLSVDFKAETGFSPSHFRQIRNMRSTRKNM
jgi:YesN/AraC family two-component response regulator